MGEVRLKRKWDAEQWVGTNTAEIVDWIRRAGDASIRWYPFYEKNEDETPAPRWMQIPEHLIIVDKHRMITTVAPFWWILRDESGGYRALSDVEFKANFEFAH